MNLVIKLGCFLVAMSLAVCANAQCLPADLSGMLSTYSGQLGNQQPIMMVLTAQLDGRVDGRYASRTSNGDIKLSGVLRDDKLTLTEYDASQRPVAVLEGRFLTHDTTGRWSKEEPLRCELFSGTRRPLSFGRSTPFVLNAESAQGGSLDHMYEVAGVRDDEIINRAAAHFRDAVIARDKIAVAKSIRYPITVQVGKQSIKLTNQQSFVQHYDQIFNQAYQKAIADAIPRLLFSPSEGVALAGGLVWFDPNGKVLTLNVTS